MSGLFSSLCIPLSFEPLSLKLIKKYSIYADTAKENPLYPLSCTHHMTYYRKHKTVSLYPLNGISVLWQLKETDNHHFIYIYIRTHTHTYIYIYIERFV